jgi:hypothetical protein
MMAERGLRVSHTTILRWVIHYVPEFEFSNFTNDLRFIALIVWYTDEYQTPPGLQPDSGISISITSKPPFETTANRGASSRSCWPAR